MKAFPVIMRELSVASRRPFTYQARGLIASLGVGAALFVFMAGRIPGPERGGILLTSLAIIALVPALLAGVFLTADCISEEKREGTLGLLFLTDLKGWDVVLGKLVAQSVAAFAALWSLLPVFAIPLLAGGVTFALTLRIMLSLMLALLFSLSVGLAVSAVCHDSRKACLGTLSGVLLLAGLPIVIDLLLASMFGNRQWGLVSLGSPIYALIVSFSSNVPGRSFGYWPSIIVIVIECVLLLIAASALTRSSWQQKTNSVADPPSAAPPAVWARRRRLMLPVIQERHYEWLCGRRAGGKGFRLLLVVLSLFWFAMLVIAVTTKHWEVGFSTCFCTAASIHLMMKLEFALESTRQLHHDARHGGLELLLVTPLTAEEIVRGHVRAYRRRFRWARACLTWINLAMLFTIIVFYKHLHMGNGAFEVFSTFFLGGIVALHVDFRAIGWIGAWRALRSKSHLKAALTTLAGPIGIPWLVGPPLTVIGLQSMNDSEAMFVVGIIWFALSAMLSAGLGFRARRRVLSQFRDLASGQ